MLALMLMLAVTAAPTTGRPNIVIAMADDWGRPYASTFGNPVVRTPTLDRLAREGVSGKCGSSRSRAASMPPRVPEPESLVRQPGRLGGGSRVEAFASLADLAPTFLELAGVPVPAAMTGRSLLPLLDNPRACAAGRDHVLTGKERHVPGQEKPDAGGTPMRAIRTRDFLYIRNFRPDRWPAGTPHPERAVIEGRWLADCDNGPTKSYVAENRDRDEAARRSWDLAFAKRPAEELYDLRTDPDQLANLAARPEYAEAQRRLAVQLETELHDTGDPRVVGGAERLEIYPYYGMIPTK